MKAIDAVPKSKEVSLVPGPRNHSGIDNSNVSTSTTQNVSEAFTEVLKYPKAKQSSKVKPKREPLPKAVSGQKFHDILEQRKQKKEEELAQK